MKKQLIFKIIKIASLVLTLFNLLMFFSMRCCWSGISKTLGYEDATDLTTKQFLLDFPVIVCFVLLAIAITNILLFKFMKKESKVWSIIMLSVNFVFLIAIIAIIVLGAIDYMYFIIPEFIKVTVITALIFFVLFMIFIYPKSNLANSKVYKYTVFLTLLLIAVLYVVNFSINTINYKPVVYAVEDKYQIVFGTSAESLGWVEINGKKYAQTSAGSEVSNTKVHKIEVPMDALNEAKEYKIVSQKFFYRGPFGAIKDIVISESYSFKPVDTTDGINYYALSDVHMETKGAVLAASYNSDMELLVLAGDVISLMNTHDDAFYTGKVAHEITKGEIPVVYARGNHEIKGDIAEEFHKYVGSKNTNFYYSFYIGDIYGLVLDMGEDHDDDYWEYYDTAFFDDYRYEQSSFITKELEKNENDKFSYQNYKYRMVVCHIPISYINTRGNHKDIKIELTEKLNQMDIDIMLSGHQHDLWLFEPNTLKPLEKLTYNTDYEPAKADGTPKKHKGMVTDFSFPTFLISKRGSSQTDSAELTQTTQIGLTVKVDKDYTTETIVYNNSEGKIISMVNQFASNTTDTLVNYTYGNEIVIDLVTKAFTKR